MFNDEENRKAAIGGGTRPPLGGIPAGGYRDESENMCGQGTTGVAAAGLTADRELLTSMVEAKNRNLLDELFSYHPPTPEQLPRYKAIRRAARNFAEVLLENTRSCGDQEAALDLIREAMMRANASIALNGRI